MGVSKRGAGQRTHEGKVGRGWKEQHDRQLCMYDAYSYFPACSFLQGLSSNGESGGPRLARCELILTQANFNTHTAQVCRADDSYFTLKKTKRVLTVEISRHAAEPSLA